ncbi:MAG: 50S ribosomal protein L22 [Deltaproteobacteria bacterium]|nr:50S ribosomal protein L22 [Candidatus Zymogenaceae bacterium]
MEIKAQARYVRMSPFKVRPVADMVRGKDVQEATEVLVLSDKKASNIVKKLLDSAVANANRMIEDKKIDVDLDNLYIRRIFVDEGPTWKRYRPRAMGRYARIFKRTSHITVILDER